MKTFFYLLLLSVCLTLNTNSQSICGTVPAFTSTASVSQPATCHEFLTDFIPKANDSVLEVKVRFIVCKPTFWPGNWPNASASQATAAVQQLTQDFTNICAPSLTMGTQNLAFTKIKFKLDTFYTITNNALYYNVGNYFVTSPYADPNSINIFFGDDTANVAFAANPNISVAPYASNIIFFNSATNNTISSPGNQSILAHEMGHALGLNHTQLLTGTITTIPDYEQWEKSTLFSTGGCCSLMYATDHVIETSTFGQFVYCWDNSVPKSNNLMSSNGLCYCYISPEQMAVMHYNLRTWKRNILTNYSYNNHLKVNTAYNYTLSTNETWSNDRHFKGNIIVPSGIHLTIQCLVSMCQGAKIIVKKGGWLTVQGGTVTNISGHLWNGIQVEGDPNYNQSIASNGFANYQGLFDIKNGGTLSNSGTACTNYITDDNNGIIWASPGGIIRAHTARFINNTRDAEFITYPYFSSGSYFTFCDFKTTGSLNGNQIPFAHVSMWDVNGIYFLGSNFEHASGTIYGAADRGIGILSMDADYTISYCGPAGSPMFNCPTTTKSHFKNLTKGVWVTNVITNRAPYIVNSEFTDNTQDAIYMHNAWNFSINNNVIHVPSGANGIYLNHSRGYMVKNNLIDGVSQSGTGITAWESQNGAHRIYRNTFSDLLVGIRPVDNNKGNGNSQDGLKMNCNVFNTTANQYDIALVGFGTGTNSPAVMKTQGVIGGLATATNVVRNLYGAFCGNQNKWFAWGNGTSTLVIDHGSNTNSLTAVTQPTPSPACSNNIVNVVNMLIPLDYTAHCITNPLSSAAMELPGPLTETYDNLNTYLGALVAQGETADLFELEATLAAKMSCFALDTAASAPDSLIALLGDYSSLIPDADLQQVFAQMHKGDHAAAEVLAATLASGREDWSTMLGTVAGLYQETEKLYSLAGNSSAQALMEEYAAEPYREGGSLAQALLFFVQGIPYTEPRPLPEETEGERRAQASGTVANKAIEGVQVYPNPASAGIMVLYNSQREEAAEIEVKDLLGRIIYTNFIYSGKENYVDMNAYSNGVYVITVSQANEIIYKQKLVKQD